MFCTITTFFLTYQNSLDSQTVIENSKVIVQNLSQNTNDETIYLWQIEIPKINCIANISEGTDEKTLDKYVGHFEESKRRNGNIALAAHNRGYAVNYFSRIKELNLGDEILYSYNEFSKSYIVISKEIIKSTDFSKIKNTKKNHITLITCVENEPEFRRCIIAEEI